MKKRLLSMLMATSLMFTTSPAVLAAENNDNFDAVIDQNTVTVNTEEELIKAISAGASYSLVTLGQDIKLTSTLYISSGVTISGGTAKHALTYEENAADGAIVVNTNDPVVMDNLTVNITNANARGIKIASRSPKFTFNNSVLNACFRGIWVGDGCDSNCVITVSNSIIQNNQIPSGKTYDNWSYLGDARGIALWDMNNSSVEVLNSSILGFGYSINLAGTKDTNGIRDYNDTNVNVTDSTIKGWTAFNVWSARTNFNITNSYLKGINTSNGPTDGFATIVVNDDIYKYGWGGADANNFIITGGTITSYRTGEANERLFRVDNRGVTKVNFQKRNNRTPVSIIDGTGDSDAVFYSGHIEKPIDWIQYMTKSVEGEENCELKGFNGKELLFIPVN